MIEWRRVKIQEMGRIVTGKTPKTSERDNYGGKIPFLTPSDDMNIKYVEKTSKTLTQKGRESVKGVIIPANTVCVSCIGSDLGKVVITTDETVTNQQINSIVVNTDEYDVDFIYYAMLILGKQLNFHSKTSTAVPIVNKSNFSNYEISCPSLKEQRKIAKILSRIDEKIDLNRKISDNLEQQLYTIFTARFTEKSAIESMPQVPLSELCSVVTKGTTPTTLGKSFIDRGINFIKAESILDNHSLDREKFAHIDENTHNLLKRSAIQPGDIIFTIAGTLGRFAMIDSEILPANTNQAVAIIRVDKMKISPEYLYCCFIGNWHNEYYARRIQQSVQANLSLTTIKSLPIPLLGETEMLEYLQLITPIIQLLKSNENENARLALMRDCLLPKLMNGEIDVSGIQL